MLLNYLIYYNILLKQIMKSILSLSAILLASTSLAYDNSPPIPERHTGYTFRGKTITNIEIEVFYDLLCEGSAYMNPAF